MKIKFLLLCLTYFTTFQIKAQHYAIDAGHSTVQIQVERFGVVDVVGRFKAVEGNISYDRDNISTTNADANIKVDSYDANNKGGEDAVKSVAFLDVANYPEITFKSTRVITKEGHDYLVGNLTLHGVTKQIELPFEVKGPLLDPPTRKQSIAFNSSITINRQDYGITFDRKLPGGIPLVSNDVRISLKILAIAQ